MKTTAIILLVIAGLMFGAVAGAIGGIFLQSRIDKAVKQAEIGEKDKEIKTLNDNLTEVSKNEAFLVKSIKNQSAEIDKKDKTIQELKKKGTKTFAINDASMEKLTKSIAERIVDGDFSEVEDIVDSLPPEYIRSFIEKMTGITSKDMPEDDADLAGYFTNIFRLIQGSQPEGGPGALIEDISFTLRVNPDNSPISPTAVFKSADRRIYACFRNQGALEGLAKVVTRWMNKTTKEVMSLGPKPINPNAPYNFVWLEKKDGWAGGEYLVELFDTKTLALIGQGTFMVLPGEEEEDKSEESKEDDLPGFEFIILGTIIEPKTNLVFIVNTISNEEKIYKEGDILESQKYGRWTIFSIEKNKVVIRQYNKDGSVAKERTLRVVHIKDRSSLDDDIAKFIKEKTGAAVKITVGTKIYSPDKRFLLECSFDAKDKVFQLWITDKLLDKRLLVEYQYDASALWSPDSTKIILNVSIGRNHPIDVCIFELDEDLRFVEDKDLEQLIVDKIINPILKDKKLGYLLTVGVGWISENTFIINAYYPDKVDLKYKVNLKTRAITEIK